MGWSWKIGRIAGIDVFVHFTFLFLLLWVGVDRYTQHYDMGEVVTGLVLILALFGIIVLHELGHALAARRYGIATRDITLLPIGGVARLERMPDDPKQELVVALAGPAVNVVLAIALFIGLNLGNQVAPLEHILSTKEGFLSASVDMLNQLLFVNIFIALFNMLPAFPMDGGRVLRALLAMRMDYVRATQVAASIGQFMALLFALWGLFDSQPFLVFIGLFVWLGAAQEASMVQMRAALDGIPVMRAMITEFHTLRPSDTLARAVEHLLSGFQQDFPVVEDGRIVGVLTCNDLASALAKHSQDVPVAEAMQRDFITAHPREMLQSAFIRLQDCKCRTLPVVLDDRLVGLLTADNISEVLMIRESLRHRGPGRPGSRRNQELVGA